MSGTVLRPRTNLKFAVAVCCAALLISACSGVGAATGAGTQRSQSGFSCSALSRHGVTTCPPANPKVASARLVNHSQGLASSAQFRRYAGALLRDLAYEEFALNTSQASILQLGLLASPRATKLVFSPDLSEIALAQGQGAKLTYLAGSVSEIKLVVLPSSYRSDIQAAGYVATQFAWIVTWTGLQSTFTTTDSGFTLVTSANSQASALLWGTFRGSSALGPVWTFQGSTPCGSDPISHGVCNQ